MIRGRMLENGTIVATGRRKTAVARVRIKRGSGKFVVNGREMTEFFRSKSCNCSSSFR